MLVMRKTLTALFLLALAAAVSLPTAGDARPSLLAEAAGRVRVPSPDVNQPPPLPVLAKPLPDRAPVDDVTGAASSAAVQSGTVPPRTKAAPFLKLTLPDPFENRKPVAPPVTPPEEVPNTHKAF
jgi:hypothetical protein